MRQTRAKRNWFDIRLVAAAGAFLFGLAFCSHTESTYTRYAIVDSSSKGLVLCFDESGNEWEFWGEGFYTGQEIKLIMDNNHTDYKITDDIIKKVLTR